ncbi:hypothetical protein V6N11_074705 [Hibiscus sabdariffa]|uniref:Uncharacterized protein n=1 Tax=Hibiscus sabdariffa TaxID=183260 RepID=A0ABR2R4D1_9ROSI
MEETLTDSIDALANEFKLKANEMWRMLVSGNDELRAISSRSVHSGPGFATFETVIVALKIFTEAGCFSYETTLWLA